MMAKAPLSRRRRIAAFVDLRVDARLQGLARPADDARSDPIRIIAISFDLFPNGTNLDEASLF
jgi:hypothetical protein